MLMTSKRAVGASRTPRRRLAWPTSFAVGILAASVSTAALWRCRSLDASSGNVVEVASFVGRAFGMRRGRRPRAQCLQSFSEFNSLRLDVGSKVQVLNDGIWYASDVLEVGDGYIKARYDFDGGEEGRIDVATRVRPLAKLTAGQQMEVEYRGAWYECKILEASADSSVCTVKYDDGGDEERDVDAVQRIRPPRVKLKHLQVGQKFRGQVVSLREFGAFVDIGAERLGLVHISRMAKKHVRRVEDCVQKGQQVDVWVSEVMPGKFALSMVADVRGGPSRHRREARELQPFAKVSIDDWLDGVVEGLVPYGAFVTVRLPSGETTNGLVHISNIQREGYVKRVEDVLSLDQEVKVRVLSVDPRSNRVFLSMLEPGFERSSHKGDIKAFDAVPAEEWLDGKVVEICPFGAFVNVTSPDGRASATGLVHITRLREGFVKSVEDEVQMGQAVRVRVTYADVEGEQMSLSMKKPISDANIEY